MDFVVDHDGRVTPAEERRIIDDVEVGVEVEVDGGKSQGRPDLLRSLDLT